MRVCESVDMGVNMSVLDRQSADAKSFTPISTLDVIAAECERECGCEYG